MFNKISIIIPTCDRHYLLESTIRACLLSDYPNYEVIVSDNYSTDETKKVVDKFINDPRIKYYRTNKRMSMPDHWDFASRKATGEFIIMNGDDDCISPNLLHKINDIINRFNPEIISWHSALYHYPDWYFAEDRNTLNFDRGHSNYLLFIDKDRLISNYTKFDFDFFPEGSRFCISRHIMDILIKRTGKLFWPISPDFTTSLLILGLIGSEKYIYIDSLLSFGGRSRDSNAAAFHGDPNKGSAKRASDFFREFDNTDIYPYHDLKIRSYYNSHAAALSLAKGLLPAEFSTYEIDVAKLIEKISYEFMNFKIENPLLDDTQKEVFQEYLKKQPEHIRNAAKEMIDKSIRITREDKIISSLVNIKIAMIKPIVYLLSIIFRNSQLSANNNPLYGKIHCQKFNCQNSFDVVKAWDRIINDNDVISGCNVDRCIKKGLLISAQKP